SVCITHHHDLDRGILARRAWRRVRVIRGLLLLDFSGPFLLAGGHFSLTIIPVVPLAVTPEAPIWPVRLARIRIVLSLPAPATLISPALRIRRKQESKNEENHRDRTDEQKNAGS